MDGYDSDPILRHEHGSVKLVASNEDKKKYLEDNHISDISKSERLLFDTTCGLFELSFNRYPVPECGTINIGTVCDWRNEYSFDTLYFDLENETIPPQIGNAICEFIKNGVKEYKIK